MKFFTFAITSVMALFLAAPLSAAPNTRAADIDIDVVTQLEDVRFEARGGNRDRSMNRSRDHSRDRSRYERDRREDRRDDRWEDREDRADDRQDRREDRRDDRHPHHRHWHPHGHVVVVLPNECRTRVYTDDGFYYYCDGVYYDTHASGYVVVAAPRGIHVHTRPRGYHAIHVHGVEYSYYYGTYYVWDADAGDYVVVEAPNGATVTYVPDNAELVVVGGHRYHRHHGVYYREVHRADGTVYVVTRI